MQNPGPTLIETPWGNDTILLGETKHFLGPNTFRWSGFGFGVTTSREILRVTRDGFDVYTASLFIKAYYTPVYRPWGPLPLGNTPVKVAYQQPSSQINAIFFGNAKITAITGTPPPPTPQPPDPPGQPPIEEVTGSPWSPSFSRPVSTGGVRMPFHVALDYEQQVDRTGGWSVNLWNNSADYAKCLKAAQDLSKVMRSMVGYETINRFLRISVAPVEGITRPIKRRTQLTEYQSGVNAGVASTEHSDYPTNSIALLLYSGPDTKVRIWLKGVRDEFIDNGGKLARGMPALGAAFTPVLKELKDPANKWCVRVIDPPGGAKEVIQIDAAGLVTCQDVHQMSDGDPVRIKNCQVNKYPNRLWRISVGSNTKQFTLRNFNPPLPFVPPEGLRIVAVQQFYRYLQIDGAVMERATKKNVGKPKGQLSGKQKKKR